MGVAANRKALYDTLREEMKDDKAQHKILPPTKFGLIQITRQRVRPELNIKTREVAPSGPGKEIEAPIVVIKKLSEDLKRSIEEDCKKKRLHKHPSMPAF